MTKDKKESTHGGFSLYLSLVVQVLLVLIIAPTVISFVFKRDFFASLIFIFSSLAGIIFGKYCFTGRFRVFLHEWKHSFVSSLAGNKAKGMKIGEDSGHFEFSYTKETAHNNVFIALAPYFVPIFSPLMLCFLGFFFLDHFHFARFLLGIAYGIDLYCNSYDVSPVQTDISNVTGGFSIGVFFIVLANLLIFMMLITWVTSSWMGYIDLFTVLRSFAEKMFLQL